jgi:hypothetical protein
MDTGYDSIVRVVHFQLPGIFVKGDGMTMTIGILEL